MQLDQQGLKKSVSKKGKNVYTKTVISLRTSLRKATANHPLLSIKEIRGDMTHGRFVWGWLEHDGPMRKYKSVCPQLQRAFLGTMQDASEENWVGVPTSPPPP
jgi:hypothetical protein